MLNTHVPFCSGGAEILAEDLCLELNKSGHNAEILTIPFKWYPQTTLVNNILACKLLDVDNYNGVNVDKVIGLKFPAWLIGHPNKSFWILHQHRTAYDLWDTEYCDLAGMEEGVEVRDLIRREDNRSIGESGQVYTISRTVSERLKAFNNINSGVMYPPPRSMESLHCSSYDDYIFFPSRINPIKRQELVIEALAYVKQPVKVVFAGDADSPAYLEKLKARARSLGVDKQLVWSGRISESEKFKLYANALMVLFTPYNEDYGYITPESMLSSKGVITFSDSGGAMEFVTDEVTGIVSEPDPLQLASKLDQVWADKSKARLYGENAREYVNELDLSWEKIIGNLV